MANPQFLLVLAALSFALAGSAFAGSAFAQEPPSLTVEGRVYCDTCRAGFETSATEYIEGAKVKLECKHFGSGEIQHTVEGVTDGSGTYKLKVTDDHAEEICEVALVSSPLEGCNEIQSGRDRARVTLISDGGLATPTRFANSVGFFKHEPLAVCGKLLQQYGLGVVN